MTCPPQVLRIRLVTGGRRRLALRLPLILFWPAALAVPIVAVPGMLVVGCFKRDGSAKAIIKAMPGLWSVLCALRGLQVGLSHAGREWWISVQ